MPSNDRTHFATVDMTMFAWLPLVHITEIANRYEGKFIRAIDVKLLGATLGVHQTTLLRVAFKTEQQSVEFAAAMRQRLNQNRN